MDDDQQNQIVDTYQAHDDHEGQASQSAQNEIEEPVELAADYLLDDEFQGADGVGVDEAENHDTNIDEDGDKLDEEQPSQVEEATQMEEDAEENQIKDQELQLNPEEEMALLEQEKMDEADLEALRQKLQKLGRE